MDARWTETCVAPRHVDVSRYFPLFSPNEQRGGGGGGVGGGCAANLFVCFPCSADHERDWPPCKVVFD